MKTGRIFARQYAHSCKLRKQLSPPPWRVSKTIAFPACVKDRPHICRVRGYLEATSGRLLLLTWNICAYQCVQPLSVGYRAEVSGERVPKKCGPCIEPVGVPYRALTVHHQYPGYDVWQLRPRVDAGIVRAARKGNSPEND